MNQNIFRRLQGAKPKHSVGDRCRTLTFAKGRKKKERGYGSGREDMVDGTKNKEPSAAEYLHFGRLIGEKTEESERKLKSKAVDIEKDDRAKLYMEKWQNEEEVSYSMFETMLGSGAEGLSRADALSFEQIVSGDYGADSGELEEGNFIVQELQGKPSRSLEKGESNDLREGGNEQKQVEPATYGAFDSLLGDSLPSSKQKKSHQDASKKKQKSGSETVKLQLGQTSGGNDTREKKPAMLKKPQREIVNHEQSYAMDQESEIIKSKEEEGDIDTNSKKEPEVQVEAALLSEEERHLSSSDGDARKAKRDANVARAIELQKSGAVLEASIWQANSGGVLISDSSSGLTGYVPFGFLSPSSARRVISAQSKLRSTRKKAEEDDPALFARQLKRQGMEILLGETICIRVVSVDEENGRVICSEKQDSDTIEPLTEANVLYIAESFLGAIVDVEVKSIKEFGVFVQFEIPGDISHRKYLGLVHSSEISWEQDDQPEIVPGAMLQAKIIHADVTKKRVFFSFKRTKANPLLETLDSLLAPSFNENRKDASNGTRNTFDSSSDMRPLLGDLQDALQLREQLCQISQITQVTLGPRLQSRASAQNVEIYLGKDGSSTNGGEGGTYKLIVRKGFDVQEMSVSANLTRAEFVAIIAPKAR